MSQKISPKKYKVKKTSNVPKFQDAVNGKDSTEQNRSREELIKAIKAEQAAIDAYNESIHEIDPFFNNIQLCGDYLIVRLKRENLIKYIDESDPDNIHIDAWVRQLDARDRPTDPDKWISTPFPYIEEGVICAISPSAQANYLKTAKFFSDNTSTHKPIIIPNPGDKVYIRVRTVDWFKEKRYYIDKQKQCEDFVKNQRELRLNNFEGYFLIESYDLEAIESVIKKEE